jgi:hypothetical protein
MESGNPENTDQSIVDLRSGLASVCVDNDNDVREQIRALHTRRNAITPFGRSPPDIIRDILELVIEAEQKAMEKVGEEHTDWKHIAGRSRAWVRILSTCTYVRAVALSSPFLWSHVDLNSKSKWIRTCIERSDLSPLSVTCRGTFNGAALSHGFASLLLQSRSISFSALSSDDVTILHHTLNQSMPSLRSLHYLSQPRESFVLSERFLGGERSGLTQLIICHVALHASNLLFPRLVVLGLSNVDVQDQVEHLLRLISSAPRLRELYISDISTSQVQVTVDTLSLPCLKIVDIQDSLEVLVLIVPKIPLPLHEFRVAVTGRVAMRWYRGDLQALRQRLMDHCIGLFPADAKYAATLSRPNNNRPPFRAVTHQLDLRIKQASPRSCMLTYTDIGRELNLFATVLKWVPKLHVSEEMLEDIFGRNIHYPTNEFNNVEDVVIGASEGLSDFHALEKWLRNRLRSGQRVNSLDITGPSKGRPVEQQKQYNKFMQRVQTDRLVNILLQYGRPFSFDSLPVY